MIELLEKIKPGEKVVYYRGHLNSDIARSTGAYRALLLKLEETARKMAKAKRIYLNKFPASVEMFTAKDRMENVKFFVYEAVGLPKKKAAVD